MKGGAPSAPAGGACAEATAYFARAGSLDATHIAAYNNFICGLVADGVWPALDALYVLGTQNTTAASLNLVSSSFPLTVNGSPNFLANDGYLGVDGSATVYINTGYNPSTAGGHYTLNSASIGIWVLNNAVSAHGGFGATQGTNYANITPRYSDGFAYGTVNSSAGAVVASSDSTGLWVTSRTSSGGTGALGLYRNGASVATSTGASTSIPNFNIYLLNTNFAGTAANEGAAYREAMAFMGGAMTATQVGNFYTRGCAFLTAVRGSCGPPPSGGVPAPAAAAGFTTPLVQADFTQTTGFWSDTTHYITNCGADPSVANLPSSWHFTSFDWDTKADLTCLPYTQLVTDGSPPTQVLRWMQPAGGAVHDQDMGFPHKVTGSGPDRWLPNEFYFKTVVRMDFNGIWQSPSPGVRGQGVFWATTTTYGSAAWLDEDFTEFAWAGPPTSYRFEGQFQEGDSVGGFVPHCCMDTAQGGIDLSSGYHTLEGLVTSNETSTVVMCIWWDGVFIPQGGSGNSCQATGDLDLGGGAAYTLRDRAFFFGLNTINNPSPAPPPNADVIMYIKSFEIWSCEGVATGTCPGTIVDHWPFP
jgi:hypothetical protein